MERRGRESTPGMPKLRPASAEPNEGPIPKPVTAPQTRSYVQTSNVLQNVFLKFRRKCRDPETVAVRHSNRNSQ